MRADQPIAGHGIQVLFHLELCTDLVLQRYRTGLSRRSRRFRRLLRATSQDFTMFAFLLCLALIAVCVLFHYETLRFLNDRLARTKCRALLQKQASQPIVRRHEIAK